MSCCSWKYPNFSNRGDLLIKFTQPFADCTDAVVDMIFSDCCIVFRFRMRGKTWLKNFWLLHRWIPPRNQLWVRFEFVILLHVLTILRIFILSVAKMVHSQIWVTLGNRHLIFTDFFWPPDLVLLLIFLCSGCKSSLIDGSWLCVFPFHCSEERIKQDFCIYWKYTSPLHPSVCQQFNSKSSLSPAISISTFPQRQLSPFTAKKLKSRRNFRVEKSSVL